jgi:hypothetical protein
MTEVENVDVFRVFKDYFHDSFVKTFKNSVEKEKTLIVEDSLRSVLNLILKPVPKETKINSILALTDSVKL